MITPKGERNGRPCADCGERIENPTRFQVRCKLCQRNNYLRAVAKVNGTKFIKATWDDIKW